MTAQTVEPETRILLIEDDLAFTALILAYLSESRTLRMDSASTLTAGLDFIRGSDYDAILLDLNLPDSRGVVTLKTVREHAPRIPIVVLTATDEDDLAIQLLQNGAEEYLVKSNVRLNKLTRVIRIAIERKRSRERLSLLESVVLNTNDAVVITEYGKSLPKEHRKIVFCNETFSEISKYLNDEAIGMSISQMFQFSPEVQSELEKACENGGSAKTEALLKRKDGTTVPVDLSFFPVIDESGEITHWVKMFRDASERKEKEEYQKRMSLMKQREDFAAVIAHDLKTPVIGANRLLGILLADGLGPLTKDQRDLLQLMQKDSENSLQKIQNVLEIFRFDVTKNELKLVPTDLAPIIRESVKEQSARAATRKIKFDIHVPVSLPDALCDEGAVRKMLANILDNAIKFSPEGGTVQVSVSNSKKDVSISVRDNGPGIAKDLQKNLFDRIWQGGPKSQYSPNTGLGLYLCKQLIDAHEGTIVCDSDTGKGTNCTITIKKQT